MWPVLFDGLSIVSEKWPIILGATGVVWLGCGIIIFLSRKLSQEKPVPWQSAVLLGCFLGFSLFLRLAYLTRLFVPPYFDSVEHFRIINELVNALESSTLLKTLPTLVPSYYHLGFHFLASLLAFGLHADPIEVILILGQVILTTIPFPIFFLIQSETHSDAAAFLGILLAGFGWYMPGFAVNWGKYPALGGLLVLELVLGIAYSITLKKTARNRPLLIVTLALAILVSTLFHTRTLVIIAIAFASWVVAGRLQVRSVVSRYISFVVLLAGILILGILIWKNPLLKLTLEPYLIDGGWITLAVVILNPFAFAKFPLGVYFNILLILLVFAAMFIPVGNWLPGFENQTLLDRPFVEILLFLPLSILGGLGLAGLLQFLSDIPGIPEQSRFHARLLTTIVVLGSAGLMSIRNYDFYPSDCCGFVGYDDTVALDWLDKNLPSDAHVLIATTQMNVLSSGPSPNLAGADAGIWIPALTGRKTTPAPFDTDFRSKDTLAQLCQKHIDYVYVGGTVQVFNASQLYARTDWYKKILSLPNAQLFQVTGCSK